MSIAAQRGSSEYQEAVKATEELESPAVGFTVSTDYKSSSQQSAAIIKQNNTLLYLVLKQSQKLESLEERIAAISRRIVNLDKRESKPEDFESAIADLTKRLDKFSISGKETVKQKQGPIYVFKDPNKILKEQLGKEKR